MDSKTKIENEEILREFATGLKDYCREHDDCKTCVFYKGHSSYGFPECGIGEPHEWDLRIKKEELL